MPVIRNPGSLSTGHGKSAADEKATRPSLTGTALSGAGPNIGTIVDENQPSLPEQPVIESVNAHVDDPKAAHTAKAIAFVGDSEILFSSHVKGAVNELFGTVMQRPPMLGEWSPFIAMSGVPDWGYLKLRDGGLENYGALTFTDATVQNDANVFPYLLQNVGPAIDTATTTNEFSTIPMSDPHSDFYFNSGAESLTEPGMGWGRAHIGAYTRDGNVGPAPLPIYRSARLYPRPTGIDGTTTRPYRVPTTVSGTIFPADRGVLALIHMAPDTAGDAKTTFLAQPLISDETAPLDPQGRVVAALLVGTGLLGGNLGGKCSEFGTCTGDNTCDGSSGGVFTVGVDADGKSDLFAYPGRATGQYDLAEIHSGVDAAANPLRSPWDDFNASGTPGSARGTADVVPAPGQVRLGTDPRAGETPVAYGIPILGGTAASYDVAPTAQSGSLTLPIHGDAIVNTNNFFRYRLPALKDYSQATGLKWTPRGEAATTTAETNRYFDVATNSAPLYPDGSAVGAYWTVAGMYDEFDDDYTTWQIARYRQTFLMPSIELTGRREEIGCYVLIHFKTEKDFERCVRDGEFPWAVADPYEVYGVSLVEDPEDVDNVANPWLAATAPVPPNGPAPLFGYNANSFHNVRSRITMDPAGTALPAVSVSAMNWSTQASPTTDAIVWVSGVAYFTPRISDTGVSSFVISQCDISLAAGFWTSYRTDQRDTHKYNGSSLVASQNPVMVATAPWGYETLTSMTVPAHSNPAVGFIPSTDYQLDWRLEFPITHLGYTGGNPFYDTNAPLDADTLDLLLPSNIVLVGDVDDPSFSRNAEMRAHFRRPMNHIAADDVNLPYTAADGHGQILTHVTSGTVLMHTSLFDKTNQVGAFGNYVVAATGSPVNTSYAALSGSAKDTSERFLDETYRYTPLFDVALDASYGAGAYQALNGPGMQGWAGGPLECPTRISLASAAGPWDSQSWLLMEMHLLDQTGVNAASDSLQVAGLPDRNPAISAVATMPFPSAGILQYPQIDYSTSHVPVTVTHMTEVQPDYSAASGVRTYLRCLDAAFVHSSDPVVAAGQAFITLRLDGVTLTDIGHMAPGPGGLSNTRLAVEVKVPGLTTWMDAGRQDGAGPSKQDPVLDGAGCLILGDETYTFTDPVSGYKGCYLKVHVGPVASLFVSSAVVAAYTSGSPSGEVPVLVRIRANSDTSRYNLEKVNTGTGTFEATSKPGADPDEVRGIIGIRLVHPDDTLIVTDGGLYPLPLPLP